MMQPIPQVAGAKLTWAEEVDDQSMYGAPSYGGSSLFGHPAFSRAASQSTYVTSPDDLGEEDDEEDDDDLPRGTGVNRAMRGMGFGSSGPVTSSIIAPRGVPDDDDEPAENLWADANEPKSKILPWKGNCPTHGPVCPKGICKEAKALKKQKEREANGEASARGGRGGGAGRGNPRDKRQKPSERENWIRPEVRAQENLGKFSPCAPCSEDADHLPSGTRRRLAIFLRSPDWTIACSDPPSLVDEQRAGIRRTTFPVRGCSRLG